MPPIISTHYFAFNPQQLWWRRLAALIRKNKTFFFANFEQYKDKKTWAVVPTVPTPVCPGNWNPQWRRTDPDRPSVDGVCQIVSINPATGLQTVNVGTVTASPGSLAAVQASNSILKFFPV